MGIVNEQRKEIERLNSKVNTLKRMCERREQELKKKMAEEAAAEIMIKILISKSGGTIRIHAHEWEECKGLSVMGRNIPEENCQEYVLLTENE